MRLSDPTSGIGGSRLDEVALEGDSLDDFRAIWDRSAKVDAIRAIASETSDEEFDEAGRPDAQAVLRLVQPGDDVLEIGCGAGRILRHVAPSCGRAHGIDISTEMIALARDRLGGLDNVELFVGNGYDLDPIADGSMDVVYSHFVLQHVPRATCFNYLLEARRVLRDGGRIRLQVPSLLRDDHFHAFNHFSQPHFVTSPYPMFFFTPIEIVSLLCRAGFRVTWLNDFVEIEARKSDEPGVEAPARQVLLRSPTSLPGRWPEVELVGRLDRLLRVVRHVRARADRAKPGPSGP